MDLLCFDLAHDTSELFSFQGLIFNMWKGLESVMLVIYNHRDINRTLKSYRHLSREMVGSICWNCFLQSECSTCYEFEEDNAFTIVDIRALENNHRSTVHEEASYMLVLKLIPLHVFRILNRSTDTEGFAEDTERLKYSPDPTYGLFMPRKSITKTEQYFRPYVNESLLRILDIRLTTVQHRLFRYHASIMKNIPCKLFEEIKSSIDAINGKVVTPFPDEQYLSISSDDDEHETDSIKSKENGRDSDCGEDLNDRQVQASLLHLYLGLGNERMAAMIDHLEHLFEKERRFFDEEECKCRKSFRLMIIETFDELYEETRAESLIIERTIDLIQTSNPNTKHDDNSCNNGSDLSNTTEYHEHLCKTVRSSVFASRTGRLFGCRNFQGVATVHTIIPRVHP
jgi:hypothetical protein